MATVLTKPVQDISEETASREWLWTSEAFYRAASAGVFDDPTRMELIHGRIIEKMPQSPLHRGVRIRMGRLLRSALEPLLTVVEECPLHLDYRTEPIPDVAVLRGAAAEDTTRQPGPEDVALVVEVCVTTAGGDLGEKALLYAQAGIEDYWATLPESRQIVVHREPTPSGYASVRRVGENEPLIPLSAPDVVLSVQEMFGLPPQGGEK